MAKVIEKQKLNLWGYLQWLERTGRLTQEEAKVLEDLIIDKLL
jgi:hypothetical protein